MGIAVITEPRAEPVDLDEAKLHLKIESGVTTDDSLIALKIRAAREYAETLTGRALVDTLFDWTLDRFPSGRQPLELPRSPVSSVVSVSYIDDAGATQTISAPLTDLISEPGRVFPAFGDTWPTTRDLANAVTVRFWSGFSTPFTAANASDLLTSLGRAYANNDILRVWNSGGALPAGLVAQTDLHVVEVSGQDFKLSLESGGSAIDFTTDGTGTQFAGLMPDEIRLAIRLLAGSWYEGRAEFGDMGRPSSLPVPVGIERLLRHEQVFRLA